MPSENAWRIAACHRPCRGKRWGNSRRRSRARRPSRTSCRPPTSRRPWPRWPAARGPRGPTSASIWRRSSRTSGTHWPERRHPDRRQRRGRPRGSGGRGSLPRVCVHAGRHPRAARVRARAGGRAARRVREAAHRAGPPRRRPATTLGEAVRRRAPPAHPRLLGPQPAQVLVPRHRAARAARRCALPEALARTPRTRTCCWARRRPNPTRRSSTSSACTASEFNTAFEEAVNGLRPEDRNVLRCSYAQRDDGSTRSRRRSASTARPRRAGSNSAREQPAG